MAVNSMFGMFWKNIMIAPFNYQAWVYVSVALPIVVVGAPLGNER